MFLITYYQNLLEESSINSFIFCLWLKWSKVPIQVPSQWLCLRVLEQLIFTWKRMILIRLKMIFTHLCRSNKSKCKLLLNITMIETFASIKACKVSKINNRFGGSYKYLIQFLTWFLFIASLKQWAGKRVVEFQYNCNI